MGGRGMRIAVLFLTARGGWVKASGAGFGSLEISASASLPILLPPGGTAGGSRVAVNVTVAVAGRTKTPPWRLNGAEAVRRPLLIRKPLKVLAGSAETSRCELNQTLPAPR